MGPALVLNELSYDAWSPDDFEARQAIGELAASMREVARLFPGVFLLSRDRLSDLAFGNGLPLRKFLALPDVKDAVLFVLSFSNRSPFSVEECDIDGYEASFEDAACVGLLHCHLLKGVALSFLSEERWRADRLNIQVLVLKDTDDDIEVVESDEDVPNLALPKHVAVHAERLAPFEREWEDGIELWAAVSVEFPNLRFLPRVGDQIQGLMAGSEALRQIGMRLLDLQRSASEWDTANSNFPQWRSSVTGEGETRKKLAMFLDESGAEHCYDLHARFTPGAGRIHFRLLRDQQLIEIAHVGDKL